MRVLITGCTGLLGRALLDSAPANATIIPCCGPASLTIQDEKQRWERLDVTHAQKTQDLIACQRPDLIIHCAAIGSVDKVQQDFGDGLRVNLQGTLNVVKAAKSINAKVVMISTNAVFDGLHPPYTEDMPLCPVNNYGIIKAAAELAVRATAIDWLVVRPIIMYGYHFSWERPNWATTWLGRLKRGESCQVVSDVITQPLYNLSCAEAIWATIAANKWGEIYHVAGPEMMTLYDFAIRVAAVAGFDTNLIQPVPSSYFKSLAPRPPNTCYDINKLQALGVDNLSVEAGIQHLQRQMLDN